MAHVLGIVNMLRSRRRPCLYGILRSPVSRTLLPSSSSSRYQNEHRQNHLPYHAAVTLVNDIPTHYHGGVVNSPAASLRIKSGLRTNCFGRTAEFVKSDPFVTIGQLPWCGTYALHSVQYRQFSVSTAANNGNNVSVSFVGAPGELEGWAR
jgi:hypothetical protein